VTSRLAPDALAAARPDPGRGDSLLDLLDDAATGRGTVHFVGEEIEPTPIGTLWDASEQAARWMVATVGTGRDVAMVLTNTRACVTALFGAWRAGCRVASLPLPARGMAPEVYVEQLARFCTAAGARTLMLDPEHVALLADSPLAVHAFDEVLSGGPPATFGGDAALVQFTSGSVGTPKGIHLTLDAVGAHVVAIAAVLDPEVGDASCSWLPLSHDMGLIGQLLTPLAAGASRFGHHCLTLMKPETFMANPRSWLRTCSQTGATITVAPNFALELAVRTSARLGALDLSHLRSIIVGSESVHADTLTRFADAFEKVGLRPLALCPAYGMAEATLAVTMVRPGEPWRSIPQPAHDRAPEGAARPLVSTGRPLDGTDVRVTGPDGVVGPIEFRSRSQLSRYIGAELHLTDDGYFATGDVGVMQDGELFVVGRGDEVIVVAGRNLYPADIESTVQHEAIRPGCIAAVAARDGGLAVVVEPKASSMTVAELELACGKIRTAVARQTGCAPATIAFVARGSLPKTPSGKFRRLAISSALATDDGLLARVDY
jgi:acyl-CoA synthetase (AMP-forming)/AMP-acid ligase II